MLYTKFQPNISSGSGEKVDFSGLDAYIAPCDKKTCISPGLQVPGKILQEIPFLPN